MKQNSNKEQENKFGYFDDSQIEHMSIEEIRKKQLELMPECKRQCAMILVLIVAILIAIFQESLFPSSEEDIIKRLQWSVYSDNNQIKRIFNKHGFETKNQQLENSNILWISNEDVFEKKYATNQSAKESFNYYSKSLISKYHLLQTLERFDLLDIYRFIGPRKFMARIFFIPFQDEQNNEDYQELTQYRQYNSTYKFLCGVESIQNGKIIHQRIIKGTQNLISIYQTYKQQYADKHSNHIFFIEKILESPIEYEERQLQIKFPISVIGKNVLYDEENIFAKGFSKQDEDDDNLMNSDSNNQQNSWKLFQYKDIKDILHNSTLEIMKFIVSYCVEAMFDQDFPNHAGRNRYSVFMFNFRIDSKDNRVYLQNIEQNPKIKSQSNSPYNKQLMSCYEHLIRHLKDAFQKKIAYNPNNTLRLYMNSFNSTLFLNDDENTTPQMFKTFAPLNYDFRIKKVVVHNFPNFLNFYQYYIGNLNYMPILKPKLEYKAYNKSADVFFSKFFPKFRPYKNSAWGSDSGWKFQTKYTFQKVIDDLANKNIHRSFDIYEYIPKTYFFNISSKNFNSPQEDQFMNDFEKLSGVWIYKPSSSYGGKGVRLVYNLSEALTDIQNMKTSSKTNTTINTNEDGFSLIQKYIEKPYLLNKKKFDFRMFPMMVSAQPLVVVYLNGYVRATLSDYDLQNPDSSIHLTNLHAQKNHPQFKELQSQAHITLEEFENNFYLKDFSEDQLEITYNHIKAACTFSLEAIYQYKQDIYGQFQAFGVDMMIDENSRVNLIEMNSNPYLINGTSLHINLVPKLLKSFLDISMEIQKQNDIFGKVNNTDFILDMCPYCDILIDETKDFNYLDYFNQKTGQFNYDNPVYKNKKSVKFK